MKLVTYKWGGEARFGVISGERIIDIQRASSYFAATRPSLRPIDAPIEAFFDNIEVLLPSLKETVSLFEAGPEAGNELSVSVSAAKLMVPIPRPPKTICVARNYAEHAKEAGLEISPIPILFARFPAAFVAPGDPVVVPSVSEQLDWEGELAVVIGKATNGKRVSKAEAMDYVFGYSIFNDVTVRDYQFRVTQYTAGKNFRSSGPFGPSIVTADEIKDPHDLQITTKINGHIEQSASTSDMIYDIPTIIENISEFIDLEPGDLIPTGTPAGVGFKRKPPVFLRPGDEVTVEIPGVGILTNPVSSEGA